jgi:hypothetical protein
MGNNTIHIGFGTPLTWGKSGKANYPGPDWLVEGYKAGEAKRPAFVARNGLKPWLDATQKGP